VIDLAEPPLQAEIIISSSMIESLILLPLAIEGHSMQDSHQPLAATLDNEDILIADRRVYLMSERTV
jgi:hypothetical protein